MVYVLLSTFNNRVMNLRKVSCLVFAVFIMQLAVADNQSASSTVLSASQPAEQVKAYVDHQDYTQAINLGESDYSKSGNSKVALYLGKAYFVKHNYKKSFEYFNDAASKGEALAMLTMGNLYGSGVGVKQNYSKAIEWYKKAVAKGNVAAMNYLGLIYRDGVGGTPKNPQAALDLFTKAADQNSSEGYFNIAYMYQNGIGIKSDYQIAIYNYTEAANLGSVLAMNNLGFMYEHGIGVPKNYRLALDWYLLSAAKGDANAECNVGEYYFYGRGVTKNYATAKNWFTIAKLHGCREAEVYLSRLPHKK